MRSLTEREKAFCRRYVLTNGHDPIGNFLDALDPSGAVPEEDLGVAVAGLLERNEIRLEIYTLQRMVEERQLGRILLELEEARQKALREDLGAELATAITVAKGQLLGVVPSPLPPLESSYSDFADDFISSVRSVTETVH